jgi:hypothetical protein
VADLTAFPEEVLGRYRLGERIAAGSLGTVVAAIDLRTGDDVAVKFFDGAMDNYAAWVDEMRLAVRLAHPHVVACRDAGYDEIWGMSVLVFTRAMGGSLRRALASGRCFSPPEVHRLLSEMAAALWHAHAQGVIHRDVKPENILAMVQPGEPPWGLTDFGAGLFLARGSLLGSIAGSLQYMAPELLGEGADATSDLYSLGVVGIEQLQGVRPELAERTAFRLAHRGRGDLAAVLACLIDPDPGQRFPSSEALMWVLARQGGFDVGRAGDGARLLLAGDEVARLRPGAVRLERIGRVPRARRFVHDCDEPDPIVAADRRVVCLDGGATTLLAADHAFQTFVASRRHGVIWTLRGDELRCSDLDGAQRRLRLQWPAEWQAALAAGAPLTGTVIDPGLAVLGVLGCPCLVLARREPTGLRATLLRAPWPLYALSRSGAQALVLCGDVGTVGLLAVESEQLQPIERLRMPVDGVRVIAGSRGPCLARLLHSGHEDGLGDDAHG